MSAVTSPAVGRNPLSFQSLMIMGAALFGGCRQVQSFSPKIRIFEPLKQPGAIQTTEPFLANRVGNTVLFDAERADDGNAVEFNQKAYNKVQGSLNRVFRGNPSIADTSRELGDCLGRMRDLHRELRYQMLTLLDQLGKVNDKAELNTMVKRITTRISLAPVVVNVDRLKQEIDALLDDSVSMAESDDFKQVEVDHGDQNNRFHMQGVLQTLHSILSIKEEYHECLSSLEKRQHTIPNYAMYNLEYTFNACFKVDPEITVGEEIVCSMEHSCPAVYAILTALFSRESIKEFVNSL